MDWTKILHAGIMFFTVQISEYYLQFWKLFTNFTEKVREKANRITRHFLGDIVNNKDIIYEPVTVSYIMSTKK